MALEIDTGNIPQMLGEMEFSRHDYLDVLTYHNRAGSGARRLVQHGHLALVTKYDSAEEAKRAEVLMDFYLNATRKGTVKYPSQDALLRAFRGVRTKPHLVYSLRAQDKIYLTIPLAIPSGDRGLESLDYVLEILDDILTSPLVLTAAEGPGILETVRKEEVEQLEDRISDHGSTTFRLFEQRYFPLSAGLPDDEERELIAGATLKDLTSTFQGHVEGSFPVFLFSGDVQLEAVTGRVIPFCTKHSGNGRESVLTPPAIEQLATVTEPAAAYGPSQQMWFLRAYPLKEVPESEEDKLLLEVIEGMLSSWTGPLYQTLREKHELVYDVQASYRNVWNVFNIMISHAPENYAQIASLTGKVMEDVARGKFSEKLFTQARDALQGELIADYTGGMLPCCKHPFHRIRYAVARYVNKAHDMKPLERHNILSNLTMQEARNTARRFIDPKRSQVFTYSRGGDADGAD